MDMAVVTLSSKGQLALPLSMRKRFKIGRGEKLVVVEEEGTIVLRPLSKMNASIDDEIYLMRRAAKGWSEIEKGQARQMSKAEFLKELSG